MRILLRGLTPRVVGTLVFVASFSGPALDLSAASPPAADVPRETPGPASGLAAPDFSPAPAFSPAPPVVSPVAQRPLEGSNFERPSTLLDIMNVLKHCSYDLLDPTRSAPTAERAYRAAEAARLTEAALTRLKRIDSLLKSDETHWKWTPVSRAQSDGAGGSKEKFVVDPPVEDASAIAFRCRKGSVYIASIKVIDSNGAPTVFPLNRECSSGQRQLEIRYLYYPTSVSTIIVDYGGPDQGQGMLDVSAGVTDLPEYAKEAIYWQRLALQELNKGELEKASDYIKRAVVKVALYRESRNRM